LPSMTSTRNEQNSGYAESNYLYVQATVLGEPSGSTYGTSQFYPLIQNPYYYQNNWNCYTSYSYYTCSLPYQYQNPNCVNQACSYPSYPNQNQNPCVNYYSQNGYYCYNQNPNYNQYYSNPNQYQVTTQSTTLTQSTTETSVSTQTESATTTSLSISTSTDTAQAATYQGLFLTSLVLCMAALALCGFLVIKLKRKSTESPKKPTEPMIQQAATQPAAPTATRLPSPSKFCVNCGFKIPGTARFCEQCGNQTLTPAEAE